MSVVDNIVNRFQEEHEEIMYGPYPRKMISLTKALRIIAQESEESDEGWIPVSSGLVPEEHDSIFAKFKGTDNWHRGMFEKLSDDVNVTIEYEDGRRATKTMHTTDGEWKIDGVVKYKVIAWQPLPKFYKGGE